MTTPKTLTAKNPGDLLALVPYSLGFHPEDSAVLLTLGGAERPFHARVDLPEDPAEVPDLVRYLTTAATRHGVHRAAVLAYTGDDARARRVAGPLAAGLERAGVDVPVVIRADGARWFCLGDDHDCPADGTPYDLRHHPFTAEAVLDGRVTYASREELAASLVGTAPEEVAAVLRAADAARDRLVAACRHPLGPPAPERGRSHLVAEGRWVAERVGRFLEDGLRPGHEEVGRLLVALASIEVRDVAWSLMCRDNAARHVDLWRDVVRRCPDELLAPPAALLGFAAWLAGDGALAWCAVDRCHRADPDYSLARLLADALVGAVPPSSWRPLDRSELPLFAS